MSAKRIKARALDVPAPRNRDGADLYIAEIGVAQRERERIETEMNEQLAALKARFEDEAKPLGERIAARMRALQVWCEANRAELTQDGRTKTVKFGSGEASWRKRPPRVTVRDTLKAIDWFKLLGLACFVRTHDELDKEAILREQNKAAENPHIKIGSEGEDFAVKPFETELEEVA